MKAAIFTGAQRPMTVEDLPMPQPKEREVLVKVAACGVCHTDLHVLKGEVAFPAPAVLGHEVSGTVQALGPGVTGLQRGDRVVCSFIMPCGECEQCLHGREDLCATFFALNRLRGTLYDGTSRLRRSDGSPVWMYSMGGLAEYAVTPATGVFKLPRAAPLPESAILGCALFTAYGALKNQAGLRAGESLAVFAVGGVGSNVLQVARAFGAGEVIAVDVRDEKLEMARSFGATETINAAREDPARRIMELTEGRGVDVAVEVLGLPQTVLQAFHSVRDGGRLVLVGIAPTGATVPLEITRLVRRGITIVGSYGARARVDMPELLRLLSRGAISVERPVTRRYSLEQVNEAYGDLARGDVVGRALIVMA